jgi:hypothetical protein
VRGAQRAKPAHGMCRWLDGLEHKEEISLSPS